MSMQSKSLLKRVALTAENYGMDTSWLLHATSFLLYIRMLRNDFLFALILPAAFIASFLIFFLAIYLMNSRRGLGRGRVEFSLPIMLMFVAVSMGPLVFGAGMLVQLVVLGMEDVWACAMSNNSIAAQIRNLAFYSGLDGLF